MGRPETDGDDAPWSADDERLAALVGREHVAHVFCQLDVSSPEWSSISEQSGHASCARFLSSLTA
jgi:hypothetical protein